MVLFYKLHHSGTKRGSSLSAVIRVSFSLASATSEELSQLATYLTRQLRKAGVSTLLLPDVAKRSQESQFLRNDEMGVPYTAVLNDNTLKTGILGLRSRETTLKEQVHVSELESHVGLLLRNY
uniref:Anticodon-binding domain-containing protein n=1 Tax=Timema monikensis TaxID=170555 RepID=A0A7R9EE16_9NEOP|nr:unnamed protein product [Timema monikensis]